MSEVERQNREFEPFGDGHHRGVDEAQIEIAKTTVDLDRAPEQLAREVGDDVFATRYRLEETTGSGRRGACTQQLVHLDDDRFRDEQFRRERRYDGGPEAMRSIAWICGCDQRCGVRDRLQGARLRRRRSGRAGFARASVCIPPRDPLELI
jgi:hypothetical protein